MQVYLIPLLLTNQPQPVNVRTIKKTKTNYPKDRNLFSIRSLSPNRWKPYTKSFTMDRSLFLGSIIITEQVETLH